MSPQRLKMTLADYQRKDGRAYQTLLEHIKRKTLDGFQENGRWYVWTDMEDEIIEGEPFEAKPQILENAGLFDFMRREQDLKKDLQDQLTQAKNQLIQQIEQSNARQLAQVTESAKIPPKTYKFNWLNTLLGFGIGAGVTSLIFASIMLDMIHGHVLTLDERRSNATKMQEIYMSNFDELKLQQASKIDNINQQHKNDSERLANLYKEEIERLRIGGNIQ